MGYDFSFEHHRRIAELAVEGLASAAELRTSQRELLQELQRVTGNKVLPETIPVPSPDLASLINALEQCPEDSPVMIEVSGVQSPAGTVSSYREFHDHLCISPGTDETRTIFELLSELRGLSRTGFPGFSRGHYPADDNTPVWVDAPNSGSGWLIAEVRNTPGLTVIASRPNRR